MRREGRHDPQGVGFVEAAFFVDGGAFVVEQESEVEARPFFPFQVFPAMPRTGSGQEVGVVG
jgi:hypothetical protein